LAKLTYIQQKLGIKMTAYYYLRKQVICSGVAGRRSIHFRAQALEAKQYTLKQNETVYFSRNLSQNMPKNGLFKKNFNNRRSVMGAPPTNPRWLGF